MWSLKYTIFPLIITKTNNSFKIVISPRGMLKPSALAIKPFKKHLFLWVFKLFLNNKMIFFHATDFEERKDIENKIKKNNINVVGNVPARVEIFNIIKKEFRKINLVCISRIHPIKNISFLIKILNEIDRSISLKLNIYGPFEDKAYLETCKSLLRENRANVAIEFCGPIQHHLIKHIIQTNHFFILPTLGENFGHSIFEAFAAARPVIISNTTPWQKLEEHSVGFDLSLNDMDLWVQTIEKCALMSQKEFDEWCINAHQFAENYLNSNNFKQEYLQLFS
ncbi:MAG TPA: glycosyltransferase [Saprospiraceae bacterium]|nr:glycosyltransferase [Saprospiraceae bacterium]